MIMKKEIAEAGTLFLINRWWCRVGFILALLLAGLYPSVAQDAQADTTATPADTTEAPAA